MQRRIEFMGQTLKINNAREDRLYKCTLTNINAYKVMLEDTEHFNRKEFLDERMYEIQGMVNSMFYLGMLQDPIKIWKETLTNFVE